jgi:hypothetical protein
MTLVDGKYWIILVKGVEVDHLFDKNGVETFDPTIADSYAIDGLVLGKLGHDTEVAVVSASYYYNFKDTQ